MDIHVDLIVLIEQYSNTNTLLGQLLESSAADLELRLAVEALVSRCGDVERTLVQLEDALLDPHSGALGVDPGTLLARNIEEVLGACKTMINSFTKRINDAAGGRFTWDKPDMALFLQYVQAQRTVFQLLLTACSKQSKDEMHRLLEGRQYQRLHQIVLQNARNLPERTTKTQRGSTVKRKAVPVSSPPPAELPTEIERSLDRRVGSSDGTASTKVHSGSESCRLLEESSHPQESKPVDNLHATQAAVNRSDSATAPQRVFLEQHHEQGLQPLHLSATTLSETSRSETPVCSGSAEADVLPWFRSGFKSLGQRDNSESGNGESVLPSPEQRQDHLARSAPQLRVAESELRIDPEFDPDRPSVEAILRRYGLDESQMTKEVQLGTLTSTGAQARIKRVSKEDPDKVDSARREIAALTAISDPCLESLAEWFEFDSLMWIILDHKPTVTLRHFIDAKGTMLADMTKHIVPQLFAGVAAIFMAGFAHLRLTDETVRLHKGSEVVISDFEYAYEYGKEKWGDMYAPVDAKHDGDIYIAPEIFESIRYNGRKAVIWSCGVLIYFMVTGQTEKLVDLGHPALGGGSRGSAASKPAVKMVTYPSRFDVPGWARDIISKMLIPDPNKRAELIEVAAKVPKEVATKDTRPLMELAWLDYKTHVGPLASTLQATASSRSSVFSGASNLSNSFGSLLGGRRKSSTRCTNT